MHAVTRNFTAIAWLVDNVGGLEHGGHMSTVDGPGPEGTLTIELEDAATRKSWVGRLGLLSGMMPM